MPKKRSPTTVATVVRANGKVFTDSTITENVALAPEQIPVVASATNSLIEYWNKSAGEHAAKVVREGGWLLHVCPLTGERRITIEEASRGFPFLSVWVREGWQYTKTRCVWPRDQHVKPRGRGWEYVDYCPKTHSTEWKRLDVEGAQS